MASPASRIRGVTWPSSNFALRLVAGGSGSSIGGRSGTPVISRDARHGDDP